MTLEELRRRAAELDARVKRNDLWRVFSLAPLGLPERTMKFIGIGAPQGPALTLTYKDEPVFGRPVQVWAAFGDEPLEPVEGVYVAVSGPIPGYARVWNDYADTASVAADWEIALGGPVVVTRHQALVDLLREQGHVGDSFSVIEHASVGDVRNRDVIGILPLHLAAVARSVTSVDLDLRPDQRGRELTLEELRAAFRGVTIYKVLGPEGTLRGTP